MQQYLDDFLVLLEELPSEIRRTAFEMRAIDVTPEEHEGLHIKQEEYFEHKEQFSQEERDAITAEINAIFDDFLERQKKRTELAENLSVLLDSYKRRYESDLSHFKAELEVENIGITKLIEDKFHEAERRIKLMQKTKKYVHSYNEDIYTTFGFNDQDDFYMGSDNEGSRGSVGSHTPRRHNSTNNDYNDMSKTLMDKLSVMRNRSNTITSKLVEDYDERPPKKRSSNRNSNNGSFNLNNTNDFTADIWGRDNSGSSTPNNYFSPNPQSTSNNKFNPASFANVHSPAASKFVFQESRTGRPRKLTNRVQEMLRGQPQFDFSNRAGSSTQQNLVASSSKSDIMKAFSNVSDRNSSVARSEMSSSIESDGNASTVEEIESEEDERIWCTCREKSYDLMVACDLNTCPYKWFHAPCVGITSQPKGQWICPTCTARQKEEQEKARAGFSNTGININESLTRAPAMAVAEAFSTVAGPLMPGPSNTGSSVTNQSMAGSSAIVGSLMPNFSMVGSSINNSPINNSSINNSSMNNSPMNNSPMNNSSMNNSAMNNSAGSSIQGSLGAAQQQFMARHQMTPQPSSRQSAPAAQQQVLRQSSAQQSFGRQGLSPQMLPRQQQVTQQMAVRQSLPQHPMSRQSHPQQPMARQSLAQQPISRQSQQPMSRQSFAPPSLTRQNVTPPGRQTAPRQSFASPALSRPSVAVQQSPGRPTVANAQAQKISSGIPMSQRPSANTQSTQRPSAGMSTAQRQAVATPPKQQGNNASRTNSVTQMADGSQIVSGSQISPGSNVVSQMAAGQNIPSQMASGSNTVSEMTGSDTVSQMTGSNVVIQMAAEPSIASKMPGSNIVSQMSECENVSQMTGSNVISQMAAGPSGSALLSGSVVSFSSPPQLSGAETLVSSSTAPPSASKASVITSSEVSSSADKKMAPKPPGVSSSVVSTPVSSRAPSNNFSIATLTAQSGASQMPVKAQLVSASSLVGTTIVTPLVARTPSASTISYNKTQSAARQTSNANLATTTARPFVTASSSVFSSQMSTPSAAKSPLVKSSMASKPSITTPSVILASSITPFVTPVTTQSPNARPVVTGQIATPLPRAFTTTQSVTAPSVVLASDNVQTQPAATVVAQLIERSPVSIQTVTEVPVEQVTPKSEGSEPGPSAS
uniref:Inhibitor of growth protein n=1 Tax=Rhabditophanes sp. KR3021 TaxID=114890 RepID=A0AC35U550_9BILA